MTIEDSENIASQPTSYEKAYIEGNMFLPQTHFGFTVLLADVVLSEGDFNVQEFSQMDLPDTSIVKIGKMMTNVHRTRNISVAHVPIKQGEEREVTNLQLQTVWRASRDSVIDVIDRYRLWTEGDTESALEPRAPKIRPQRLEAVKEFLGDPENVGKIEKLRILIDNAAGLLRSEEVRPLRDDYLGVFKVGVTDPNERKIRADKILLQIKEDINKRLHGRLNKDADFFEVIQKNYY